MAQRWIWWYGQDTRKATSTTEYRHTLVRCTRWRCRFPDESLRTGNTAISTSHVCHGTELCCCAHLGPDIRAYVSAHLCANAHIGRTPFRTTRSSKRAIPTSSREARWECETGNAAATSRHGEWADDYH